MKTLFAFTTGIFTGALAITFVYVACTAESTGGDGMKEFIHTVYGA